MAFFTNKFSIEHTPAMRRNLPTLLYSINNPLTIFHRLRPYTLA